MIDYKKSDDIQLVEVILQNGDNRAFGELYDRYSQKVYAKCLSFAKDTHKAEDLTHDVFIKVMATLKSFQGKSKFSVWLYSVTYNFCVDYTRKESSKPKWIADSDDTIERMADIDIPEVDEELFAIRARQLQKMLDQIHPQEKMMLLMKYQDDLSIEEIGDALNLKNSAVKMRLKRARDKVIELQKKLDDGQSI